YLGLIGPRIMSDGEGAQVGAGAAARVTFTIVPSSWLEGSLRWLWGFLMANPWIAVLGLLLIVLLLAWLFRRRFRISVARRA
ncbi:MAG TPA: LPXTG cell wall anchor domain-containing protein, partial [Candidatus Limnocylindrales bacterium]|nr:LPXTG cell wall anchor domain-containing protein [Candidatus Limnocylindrales bacterium]